MNIGILTNIHNVSCGNNGLGKPGGLTFLQRKYANLDILNSNKNMIDFYIMCSNFSMNSFILRGTGINGYPKRNKKLSLVT